MAWVAVCKNLDEWIFSGKPFRGIDDTWWEKPNDHYINLPSGSIEKLIGRKLTWEDEPVELI